MQCTDLLVRTNFAGQSRRFYVISSSDSGTISTGEFEELLRTKGLSAKTIINLREEFFEEGNFCVLADIDTVDMEIRQLDRDGLCLTLVGERLLSVEECFGTSAIGGDLEKYRNVFEVYVPYNLELIRKLGYSPNVEFVKIPNRFSMRGMLEFNVIPMLKFDCDELYLVLWQYMLGSALQSRCPLNNYEVGQKLAYLLEQIKNGEPSKFQSPPLVNQEGLTMWEVEARKARLKRYVKRIEKKRETLGNSSEGFKLLETFIHSIVRDIDLALELWVYYSWEIIDTQAQWHDNITGILWQLFCNIESNQGWNGNPSDL